MSLSVGLGLPAKTNRDEHVIVKEKERARREEYFIPTSDTLTST